MLQRLSRTGIVILILIVIGLIDRFVANPSGMIIPVLVFGIVLFLYKFPPRRLGALFRRPEPPARNRKPRGGKERKPHPFKVIQGNKKDDEDQYPYH